MARDSKMGMSEGQHQVGDIKHWGELPGYIDQKGNGSMDYLSQVDAMAAADDKKIKRSMKVGR